MPVPYPADNPRHGDPYQDRPGDRPGRTARRRPATPDGMAGAHPGDPGRWEEDGPGRPPAGPAPWELDDQTDTHLMRPAGRRAAPTSVGRRRAVEDTSGHIVELGGHHSPGARPPGFVPPTPPGESGGRRRASLSPEDEAESGIVAPRRGGRRFRPDDPADQPQVPVSAPPGRQVRSDPAGADGESDDLPVPVAAMGVGRRFLSLLVALFCVGTTVAVVCGAQLPRTANALVILGLQVLFVLVWTVSSHPPAPRVVAAVGLIVAMGTDIAATVTTTASLEPLGYLTAAGFVVGVVGQLVRPAGRQRVTESLGSSLVINVGVVAFATLVELTRHPHGTQAVTACMCAAGIAVAVARLVDVVVPLPRIAPHVPRGGVGVVVGAMAGTLVAAVIGYYLQGLDTRSAAFAGLATAFVAVMVDLSVGYAEAARRLDGDDPASSIARHVQGPLGAIAFAAPVAYAASVLLFE